MSLLDAFGSLFPTRRPALADGPTEVPDTNVMASMSSTAVAAPPAMAAPAEVEVPEVEEELVEPTKKEQQLMLHLSNVSHGVNHFQNQMMTMLYPSIMAELGISYVELGVLTAVRSMITAVSQGAYGFVTPFVSRCKILGYSNIGIAIGTILSGLALSYPMLVAARCVASLGSSAQHPVGYSILASYFPKTRGTVMALNTSASNVGTLIATPLATVLLLMMGWRQIFYIVAFASVIMGVVYLLFRDYGNPNSVGDKKKRLSQGFRSYGRVLRNRNMMILALVFMVGAAGAEGGIDQTYFAPHLMNDFGYGTLIVGVLITSLSLGRIVGPIIFGWLSDRLSRTAVLQASLALSAVGTLWVAWLGPSFLPLLISLFVYASVTSSRGTLTQALVTDAASDEDRDAALSMYFLLGFVAQPLWLLITGFLMETQGFGVAVSRLAGSYLIGMVLLFFIKDLKNSSNSKKATAVA